MLTAEQKRLNHIESQKKYQAKNAEKAKKWRKAYYDKNAKVLRAKRRERYQKQKMLKLDKWDGVNSISLFFTHSEGFVQIENPFKQKIGTYYNINNDETRPNLKPKLIS